MLVTRVGGQDNPIVTHFCIVSILDNKNALMPPSIKKESHWGFSEGLRDNKRPR